MSRFQPALLGGLFIGIMSALPGVSFGNCCCCLWVLSGGMLTTYLLQGRQDAPVETSEVMVQGLIAGAVGGVLAGMIGVALQPVIGPWQQRMIAQMMERFQAAMPPESRQQFDEAMRQQGAMSTQAEILRSLMFIPVSAAFATAGAALGLAFFRKKRPPQVQA
jgi:hypothetical protein